MEIHIKGARVHNLKNIELRIPHNKLVVITGLSGSGKSTLAFDTIFAEGQRRYVESLSAYARQFLGRIEKPDVDSITGIAPAIAVEQKVNTRNPRSTVGTSTEIYEYLRLLFARIGRTYSPISGVEVVAYSADEVVNRILKYEAGQRIVVSAPLVLDQGQGVIEKLTLMLRDGFQRLMIGGDAHSNPFGRMVTIEDYMQELAGVDVAQDDRAEGIDLVIDRLVVPSIDTGGWSDDDKARLVDSVQRAMAVGGGVCRVNSKEYSSKFEADGLEFTLPFEHMFSFNNPLGACPRCQGYGKVVGIDEELVIPDKSKSIYDDAVMCWRGESMKWWKEQLIMAASKSHLPIHTPFYMLDRDQKMLVWTGNEHFLGLNAFFEFLEKERYKIQYRVMLSRYTGKSVCGECCGGRLKAEATYVKVGGRSIVELVNMPVDELIKFFEDIELTDYERGVAERVLMEVRSRLSYLNQVGLGYLTLDRGASTLSGGESQRINLSTSLGSSLVGSLYILDEPSIGLHPRDTHKLIGVLGQLRDLGNTVIVVEHEKEIISSADQIIDIGPEAGVNGGEVVYQGGIEGLKDAALQGRSLTALYMTGMERVAKVHEPRSAGGWIKVLGARANNLKNIDVDIPLGVISCVTGVSGSGKSSLCRDIVYPALFRHFNDTGNRPGDFDGLSGDLSLISGVEMIDQNPIGKSQRSNPVTYIKAWDEIRRLFSEQTVAKNMGYDPSSFSFNIAGGRCENCKGEGLIRVSMQFMADVELVCEVCSGKRFKDSVLEVRYKGCSIFDVLEMSVDQAIEFFEQDSSTNKLVQKIIQRLSVLQQVGLGYVKLGQSSSTLSGGESQRVKLAYYLLKENSQKPLIFIFDEPTTGLHFHDIKKLLVSFEALIEKGHTIVIVEHNMDVVMSSDWVIDLGPEGGDKGGQLVYQGVPSGLMDCEASYTGQFLKQEFQQNQRGI